jgi:hypothetical protein
VIGIGKREREREEEEEEERIDNLFVVKPNAWCVGKKRLFDWLKIKIEEIESIEVEA